MVITFVGSMFAVCNYSKPDLSSDIDWRGKGIRTYYLTQIPNFVYMTFCLRTGLCTFLAFVLSVIWITSNPYLLLPHNLTIHGGRYAPRYQSYWVDGASEKVFKNVPDFKDWIDKQNPPIRESSNGHVDSYLADATTLINLGNFKGIYQVRMVEPDSRNSFVCNGDVTETEYGFKGLDDDAEANPIPYSRTSQTSSGDDGTSTPPTEDPEEEGEPEEEEETQTDDRRKLQEDEEGSCASVAPDADNDYYVP